MRRILPAGTVLLVLSASAALAQQVPGICGNRSEMQKQLRERFNEQPTRSAAVGNSAVVELMTSESGSWTVLLSFPDGSACRLDRNEAGGGRAPPPVGRNR